VRYALLLICAGIASATFVADISFALTLCLIFIAVLLFSLLSPGSQDGSLLIALLLGDRSAISQDSWELFTATESNHLFVI
jgi:hypothetical protein